MIRLFGLFILLLLTLPADAAPREVEITATGATSQEAITQGLVQALEQVSGVALASNQLVRTELSSQVTGDQATTTLTQQQQSQIRKLTGGNVTAYRVLATSDGPPVTVQMAVTIEVFEAKGLGNETRRRIVVATFSSPGSNVGRAQPGTTADTLRDRITASLVQARRFAVIDRAQDLVYAQEMALLHSGDAPATERVRIGQTIGADYVVTGKLRQTSPTRTDRVLEITGEVLTSTTAGNIEADFQVIEIATRQIKSTGSMRFSGAGAIDRVGASIAEAITQAVYPMRLIRFEDPANLIVNQGGGTLVPGQRFRAMVMGEMMTDPYTHEELGQLEQEVGVVEIVRVDSKISYAQLIAGHLPGPGDTPAQIVLRPAAPPSAPARARRATPAREAPSITKLPYDS